jgi:anti-sigma regulatory factor (Ser/Thr protein kinase)
VPDPSGTNLRTAPHATFTAEPASVPDARHFVAKQLTGWGCSELVDDAATCVTELAANAAQQRSCSSMAIELTQTEHGVRISVEDDGTMPVGSMVATRAYADDQATCLDDELTGGRGLAIVTVLSSDWGVEQTTVGKLVWFELRPRGR